MDVPRNIFHTEKEFRRHLQSQVGKLCQQQKARLQPVEFAPAQAGQSAVLGQPVAQPEAQQHEPEPEEPAAGGAAQPEEEELDTAMGDDLPTMNYVSVPQNSPMEVEGGEEAATGQQVPRYT